MISKEPITHNLEVDRNIEVQVMKAKYVVAILTNYEDLGKEVKDQLEKANRIAGCLNNAIWRNKRITKEAKFGIYKAIIISTMSYISATRPNMLRTLNLMKTAKMRLLREIAEKNMLVQLRKN